VAVDARYLARPGVGIHRYLVSLLELLDSDGCEVTLLVESAQAHVPALEGRRCVALHGAGLRWEQWSLPRHLRAGPGYDLLLCPANRGVPLLPHSTRTALVVHDLIPLVLWRIYLRGRVRFSIDYVLAHGISLARAGTLMAVSESTACDIRRFTGRRSTVVHQPSLPVPVPHVVADGPRTVVYNGGDDPRKQVPLLIDAFARVRRTHPDLRLQLVGRGYEHYRGELAGRGLLDHVELAGLLSEAEKDTALATADVLALPSLYEGFALPVVEAFACGTPVVTGEGGALAEVGGDAVLRVDVTDPEAVADGIRRALDPVTAAALAAAGRRRLEELRALDGPRVLVETLRRAASRCAATVPGSV